MKTKVSVIGAGNVGATTAELIARDGLADVVLYDIHDGLPHGKALDITQACPLWNSSSQVTGTNMLDDTAGSDIVVITAGLPRKPGMSRDDLLHANAEILQKVTAGICRFSPDCILIVVTNPMDVMAQLALKTSGFEPRRVIGMGGVLDASRLRAFISRALNVSPSDIEALVLGGHGDQMVPLPRFTTVKGVPITELMSGEMQEELVTRTRNGGAEIVSLLKSGSAYYAPAASTVQMVKAILQDENRLLPCSAYLQGEYGIRGVFVGVPVILGRRGVERVVEVNLDANERALFDKSVASVRTLLDIVGG